MVQTLCDWPNADCALHELILSEKSAAALAVPKFA
jgi:hypothetical protein